MRNRSVSYYILINTIRADNVEEKIAHMRRDVFQAIADPKRREILGILSEERLNLNAIAERFDISRPAVSKHIRILKECGLLIVIQEGRDRFCEVRLQPLSEVNNFVERYRKYWDERFNRLDDYLKELQGKDKKKNNKENQDDTGKEG